MTYAAQLAAIPDVDIAWFAGWLSADGSIQNAGGGRPKLRFVITDRDPLERFAALFGNNVSGPIPPSGLGKKPRYEWQVTGEKAVQILQCVYPWLSQRYKERADRVMGYALLEHRGKKLTPADVVTIKAELATGGHGIGRKLARQFGVTDKMISSIRHGRAWAA